jgi:hypothetical protein
MLVEGLISFSVTRRNFQTLEPIQSLTSSRRQTPPRYGWDSYATIPTTAPLAGALM